MKTTNFQLIITLGTPIHMRHKMTLDGLLSAAVHNKLGLTGEDTYPHIPLAMERDVFKGSCIVFPDNSQHTSFGRVMALRGPDDLSPTAFSPNVRGKRYGAVDQQRGPYKANLSRYPAISAPEAYFFGQGDPDACVALIQNHILGLGKRATGGAGEIIGITWLETETDLSWINDCGMPARPLPEGLWQEISGAYAPVATLAVRPPYWMTERVRAVFPA